ncbi:MAG TPA: TraB/GumN family protein [Agriterribacter sp.]|uniref:TraB/GumN family protein n=1 Tax=Agriterribacter sp. TaxID=2821509 RepID=UPI002C633F90|nr:TraB/GumN family protein [Agriterribacter sp.]HRQ18567.1 TraB/GumN family protein [Agriterribacter sp.]
MRKLPVLFTAFFVQHFCAPAVTAQTDNALLWEISGNGISSPSYLYGTVHMICTEDFVTGKQLQEKFKSAQKVFLEVDMDDPAMNMKMMQLSLLQGKKLSDMFSDSDYNKLNIFFRDTIGMPLTLLNTMKPFVLFSILTLKSLPCAEPQSYEMTFVNMAKEQNKEVLGLETIEDQMKIFDDMPDSVQVQMVMRYVNEFDEQKKEFAKMVNAYKQENLDMIYRQIMSSPDIAGSEEVLLYNRNRRWIPVMENAMQSGKIFFAVGAGHLGGPKGIINLLREKGYTVKGIKEER